MMATEKRLIDANALIESGEEGMITDIFPNWLAMPDSAQKAVCEYGQFLKNKIKKFPTVDAVEVIRCKNCASGKGATHKVCPLYKQGLLKDDDYCSVGERKDNGKN